MLGLGFELSNLHFQLFDLLCRLDQVGLLGGLRFLELGLGLAHQLFLPAKVVLQASCELIKLDFKLVLLIPLLALLVLDPLYQQVDRLQETVFGWANEVLCVRRVIQFKALNLELREDLI